MQSMDTILERKPYTIKPKPRIGGHCDSCVHCDSEMPMEWMQWYLPHHVMGSIHCCFIKKKYPPPKLIFLCSLGSTPLRDALIKYWIDSNISLPTSRQCLKCDLKSCRLCWCKERLSTMLLQCISWNSKGLNVPPDRLHSFLQRRLSFN